MQLYNAQTREIETIDDPVKLQEALLAGSHSFAVESKVEAFSPDGRFGRIPAMQVQDAIQQGYKVATPTQIEVQNYVKENQGLSGAARVFIGQALDEGLLGIPELIADNTLDPLEVAKKDALKNYHSAANTIGGITGFGASMLYGGPLFKGAAKGGEAVAKLGTHIADKILLKSAGEVSKSEAQRIGLGLAERVLKSKTLEKGVQLGTEGALLSAPYAVTEAALGNPGDAAETILAGGLFGSLFGVGGKLTSKFFKKASSVTKADGLLTKIRDDLSSEGLQLKAGEKTIEALNPTTSAAEKLQFFKSMVEDGEYIIKPTNVIKDKDAMGYLGKFLMDEGIWDKALRNKSDVYEWLQVKIGEKAKAVADKFDNIDAQFGERVMVDANEVAEKLRSTVLKRMRENPAIQNSEIKRFEKILNRFGSTDENVVRQSIAEELEIADQALESLRKSQTEIGEALLQEMPEGLRKQTGGDFDYLFGFAKRKLTASEKALDLLKDKGFRAKTEDFDEQLRFILGNEAMPGFETMSVKQIRDSLNKSVTALKKAMPLAENIRNEVRSVQDQISMLSRYDEEALSPVWTLREANQKKGDFQARAKSYGKLGDQVLPDFWNEVAKEINRTIRDTIKKAGGEGETLLDDLIKTQEALANFKTVEGIAAKAATKETSLNDFGINSFITAGPTSIIGGLMGGGVGALAGAAIGMGGREFTRRYGDQLSAIALNKMAGQQIAVDGLKAAASRIDEMPQILAGLRAGIKSRTKASPVSPTTGALLGYLALSRESDRRKAKLDYMAQINEKIAKLASSPVILNKELDRFTSPLANGGAPNIGKSLHIKMQEATKYLQDSIPRQKNPTNPFAPKQAYVPSDREIKAFEDKLAVVQDPFIVLDELQAGTLNKNHMDALIRVYPGIHSMIQRKVQETVAEGVEPVPYAARMKLSLLLRAPMDETMTPQAIAYYQQSYAAVEEGEQPQGATGGVQANVEVAGNAFSSAQQLMRG